MSHRFFIRLNGSEKFEEVSEQVFMDRRLALNDSDLPRYADDHFVVSDGHIQEMQLRGIKKQILPIISRILGLPEVAGSTVGGWCSEPTHVKFKKGRSRWLLEVQSGTKYRQS